MIDFNFENNAKVKPGSVLISEPFLDDDYFSRSVIFLCDHNEEGSFGFVLNKYIENDLSELIEGFPSASTKVSVGGPVDTSNLFYIHSLGEKIPNSTPTSNNLSIGGDFNKLQELILFEPELIKQIRFFIGYSGWEKDQLNNEIDSKSWLVLNGVSPEQILDTNNDDIWKKTMKSLGGKFEVMSRFPKNPSDN